ncbi:RNA-directed DNA polymerase, eukaryota, reverse transcriptase zinc-binding domain protein [Tanacetum coccineum]
MNHLRIKLGNGELTSFWDDDWCEGGRLKDRFPRTYALDACKEIMDRWTWTLNASGDFSVASVRNLIDTTMLPKGEYQTRWIRVVPIKVNTFAWKVMTNSLPTRFNISRRGIDIDSISCGNCDLGVETSNHLFFTCDMAKQITRLIMRWWDVPELEIDSYYEL